MQTIKKINEDKRGYILLVNDLLDEGKEFTFMFTKKGYARGGCLHSKDEHYVVIDGIALLRCKIGEKYVQREVKVGCAGNIPAGTPHAFIAVTDCIISEWGITTAEKEENKKDEELFQYVKKINDACKTD